MNASETLNEAIATLLSLATSWGFQVLGGVLVFLLGLVASRLVRRTIMHLLDRARLDSTRP